MSFHVNSSEHPAEHFSYMNIHLYAQNISKQPAEHSLTHAEHYWTPCWDLHEHSFEHLEH